MPNISFNPVHYEQLNSRQQENYNFHHAAAVLAEYGYTSIRLSDDWNGADFIALHTDGHDLRIQLKGRLYIDKKYIGKNLWIAFVDHTSGDVYIYEHDYMVQIVLKNTNVENTDSWTLKGAYGWKTLSKEIRSLIEPFRLPRN
jgi:hypothetical protein